MFVFAQAAALPLLLVLPLAPSLTLLPSCTSFPITPTARYTTQQSALRRAAIRSQCCEDALVGNVARSAVTDVVAPCDGAHDVANRVNELEHHADRKGSGEAPRAREQLAAGTKGLNGRLFGPGRRGGGSAGNFRAQRVVRRSEQWVPMSTDQVPSTSGTRAAFRGGCRP
ncbi:hypothetical protein EV122DRAFT_255447 [Schizophyllum commune]